MRRDRSRSRRETGKRAGEALESSASKHGGQRRVGGSQIGRRGGPGEGREAWEYWPDGAGSGALEEARAVREAGDVKACTDRDSTRMFYCIWAWSPLFMNCSS